MQKIPRIFFDLTLEINIIGTWRKKLPSSQNVLVTSILGTGGTQAGTSAHPCFPVVALAHLRESMPADDMIKVTASKNRKGYVFSQMTFSRSQFCA